MDEDGDNSEDDGRSFWRTPTMLGWSWAVVGELDISGRGELAAVVRVGSGGIIIMHVL